MEIKLPIKKILQSPQEPYCGAITYCALKGISPTKKKVAEIHQKARIEPSLGIFYPSFHKLDNKAISYVSKQGAMLDPTDTKCFETMWAFEKKYQEKNGLSKKEFIRKVVQLTKKLYKSNKDHITLFQKFSKNDYKKILLNNISSKKRPVGLMIIEDLHSYTKTSGHLEIPHWITIHGIRKNKASTEYLVFNSFIKNSQWLKENDLFKKINRVKRFGFSPQFVTIN